MPGSSRLRNVQGLSQGRTAEMGRPTQPHPVICQPEAVLYTREEAPPHPECCLDTERTKPPISNFYLQQRMGVFCIHHPALSYHSSQEESLFSTLLQKPLESLSPSNPETTAEPGKTATLAGGEERVQEKGRAWRSGNSLQASAALPSLRYSEYLSFAYWKSTLQMLTTLHVER